MDAQECIDALDRALGENGETIILRHISGTGSSQTFVDVKCHARVTAITTEEIAAGIVQTDQNVTISPTEIIDSGWPGVVLRTGVPPFNADPSIPRVNVDKAIVQNRLRTIVFVDPQSVNGKVVRINMRVAG